MTRSEAVPGAVVVRVRPLGSRVGRCVYQITGRVPVYTHWRDLSVWTRGGWRETVASHVDALRLATEEEKRAAGVME